MTDAGVKELAAAKSLERLALAGTNITDAVVPEFARFPRLRTLEIDDCPLVTRASWKELAKLKSLRRLAVSGMRGDEAAGQELRDALPECEVRVSYAEPREEPTQPPPGSYIVTEQEGSLTQETLLAIVIVVAVVVVVAVIGLIILLVRFHRLSLPRRDQPGVRQ